MYELHLTTIHQIQFSEITYTIMHVLNMGTKGDSFDLILNGVLRFIYPDVCSELEISRLNGNGGCGSFLGNGKLSILESKVQPYGVAGQGHCLSLFWVLRKRRVRSEQFVLMILYYMDIFISSLDRMQIHIEFVGNFVSEIQNWIRGIPL